ncbi:hypothetical protein V1512DRAFT_247403 [Lipomyces arxii]|uniref:uncharacterized protein n=1 Tax=Lipomyces arxii TaxID=56418 RepID=UPI0034CD4B22
MSKPVERYATSTPSGRPLRSGGAIITVHWSDGDKSMHPANRLLNSLPKPDGSLNYYVKILPDDSRYRNYLSKLSAMFAEAMKIPQGNGAVMLKFLPEGYALYDQVSSKPGGANKETRMYMFGHPSGRKYRTTYEFLPHLLWLATDGTHDRSRCECELCTIRSMGLLLSHTRNKSTKKLTPERIRAMARMALAKAEKEEDRKIGAPWYRLGEIVQYLYRRPGEPTVYEPALVVSRPELHDNEASVDKELQEQRETEGYSLYALHKNRIIRDVKEKDILPWLARTRVSKKPGGRLGKMLQSWSVFDRCGQIEDAVEYNGLFLGAEKIWKDEAVRLVPVEDDGDNANDSKEKDIKEEILVIEKILLYGGDRLTISGSLFEPGNPEFQRVIVPNRVSAQRNWKLSHRWDEETTVEVDALAGRWYSDTVCRWRSLREADVQTRVASRHAVFSTPL